MTTAKLTRENEFSLNPRLQISIGRKYSFAFISIFFLLLLVYANSFQGTWVFDDFSNIVENQNIHIDNISLNSLKQSIYDENGKLNRPLAYLSFGINYYIGGTNVFGYHLVNFFIHYLTSLFLFLFIFKTLRLPRFNGCVATHAYSIALIATIFWAASPIQVTAVTYIVQRMTSMAGLFYIMAMYFYLLGRTTPARRKQISFFGFAIFCSLLSFATKENTLMLPASIFIYDFLLIQGVSKSTVKKNIFIVILPLAFLAICFFLLLDFSSILQGYEHRPFTIKERLLTEPRIIFFYISQLLYPLESKLMLVHDFSVSTGVFSPLTTLLSILGIIGAIIFSIAYAKKYPLIVFCILFFFINHIIESSFLPLELIYEHRNYIPSFFFFLPIAIFIVYALNYFSYRRFIQFAIVLLLAIVLIGHGHTVYKRNALFADPYLFWLDNVSKAPGLSVVHNNFGTVLKKQGDYQRAYEHFLISEKLGTYNNIDNEAMNLFNLGGYYLYIGGRPDLAHAYFERSLKIYPGYWRFWHELAVSKISMKQFSEAEKLALKLNEKFPNNDYFKYVLSLCYLKQNKLDKSKEISLSAIRQKPNQQQFLMLLGAAYYYKRDFENAANYWNKALLKEPENRELLFALVDTYHKLHMKNERDKAIKTLENLKKNKSWDEIIMESAKKNPINFYEINISKLLPIIKESL